MSTKIGYCNYRDHRGPRELPAERFGKYRSGNPKSICRLCDSARASEYKKRMLANPETAKRYRETQRKYARKWAAAHPEKQRQYRKEWEERNTEFVKQMKSVYEKRRDPARRREIQRRWRAKVMADPVRHAAFLENRRLQYHLRKETKGQPAARYTFHKDVPEPYMLVDAAPLKSYVYRRELSQGEIARAVGIDEAGIRRILDRTRPTRVSLFTVDKVLTAFDGPPYQSLYPDV